MKVKHIPHYLIVLVSVLYNAYTAGQYTCQMLPTQWAYGLALVLSICAHFYIVIAIQHFKESNSLNVSVLVAGVLVACCVYADIKGVSIVQHHPLDVITQDYRKQIAILEEDLRSTRHDASKARTKVLRSDLLALADEQQRSLDNKQKAFKETRQEAKNKAEQRQTTFQAFSVLLFFLSCCVAYLMVEQQELPTTTATVKAQHIEADLQDTTQVVPIKPKPIRQKTASQQKIGFAVNKASQLKAMWEEGVNDTRTLAKSLGVNFKQLKELKVEAGIT